MDFSLRRWIWELAVYVCDRVPLQAVLIFLSVFHMYTYMSLCIMCFTVMICTARQSACCAVRCWLGSDNCQWKQADLALLFAKLSKNVDSACIALAYKGDNLK